jgi:hypothetical protein
MKRGFPFFIALCVLVLPATVQAAIADFEDLPLAPDSFYNGDPGGLAPGQSHDGSFVSGTAKFNNSFAVDAQFGFTFWNGWSYSNKTDTTTPGFANQYSAIAGGGSRGSATYGIGFMGIPEPTIELPAGGVPVSIDITNTTYAAMSMLNGDAFSKRFGDDPATPGAVETNVPDFFKLTIGGLDASGQPLSSAVDVYLADYRFANDTDDFVLQSWKTIDLAPLSGASRLTFALQSSDVGPFGSNTPAYFAADHLVVDVVPEPSTLVLLAASLLGVTALALCQRHKFALPESAGTRECPVLPSTNHG